MPTRPGGSAPVPVRGLIRARSPSEAWGGFPYVFRQAGRGSWIRGSSVAERGGRDADVLEDEFLQHVCRQAPELLEVPVAGAITAAQILVGRSHPGRFRSEAAFASFAPVPAPSGLTDKHRLDRGGDRRPDRAMHTITRSPDHPITRSGCGSLPPRRRTSPAVSARAGALAVRSDAPSTASAARSSRSSDKGAVRTEKGFLEQRDTTWQQPRGRPPWPAVPGAVGATSRGVPPGRDTAGRGGARGSGPPPPRGGRPPAPTPPRAGAAGGEAGA
ncbi:transposase, partial [Streptomyces sp. NPDC057433]|uniref:transposase n=1 Tax=Streptomyces sp. NPDC057433 TaxID=3346132 RepID=UPI0036C0AF9B